MHRTHSHTASAAAGAGSRSRSSRPTCPRCGLASGLALDRPSPDRFHAVYRCDGRLDGCGFLWSPK